MSVINLSEEYRRNHNPSALERIRMALDLDLYWASSLSAMESHFQKNPPLKLTGLHYQNAAYVVFRDMEMKTISSDDFMDNDGASSKRICFENDDEASLIKMDEGLHFPLLVIQDETRRRLAYWMAGKSEEYLEAKKRYGFDNKRFVSIPKIFVQYNHDNNGGFLMIKGLSGKDVLQKDRKSIRERIVELMATADVIPSPA